MIYPNRKDIFLVEDNWSVWHKFYTKYLLIIFDAFSNILNIGSVKIG